MWLIVYDTRLSGVYFVFRPPRLVSCKIRFKSFCRFKQNSDQYVCSAFGPSEA